MCVICFLFFFFFFSSRRRHTRSLRDWSSDVCSSDLAISFPELLVPRCFRDVLKLASEACRQAQRRSNFPGRDRKSTRLNSSHVEISYAVFCLKKKKKKKTRINNLNKRHASDELHVTC